MAPFDVTSFAFMPQTVAVAIVGTELGHRLHLTALAALPLSVYGGFGGLAHYVPW